MPYVPIRIPPGMLLNTTEYDAKGRWVGGNLIRFWREKVRPVGGWTAATTAAGAILMDGVARCMHPWRDLSEAKNLVIGTNSNLYHFDGSNIADISPVTHPIPPGDVSGGTGDGFGGFTYGTEDYGDSRTFQSLTFAPASWTMDNWGEEWVGCANWEGSIYKWAPGDAEATLIEAPAGTEVPQLNRAIIVTDERHLVAIGAGVYGTAWTRDQRRVAWSDQEDYSTWTPSITNGAGDLQLQTSGLAMTGVKFKGDILIWTDVDVHRMSYLGPPYFYGISRIADNAGIVSTGAHAVTNKFVFWVARDAFMVYDGSVRELAPTVSEWYRDRVNPQHIGKIIVGHNPRFNEIWVFLPGEGSDEISEYIIWNYEENTWVPGNMSRTSWDETAIFDSPMATEPVGTDANPQSKLLVHESGWTNDGASRNNDIYIETSPIEIATGENLVAARRLIQDSSSDEEFPSTSLRVSFELRLAPEADTSVEGPYNVDTARGYTDVRFTGRQMKMKFEQIIDGDWSIGDWRLEIIPGSGR